VEEGRREKEIIDEGRERKKKETSIRFRGGEYARKGGVFTDSSDLLCSALREVMAGSGRFFLRRFRCM
jgi:hypothetical protein